MTLIDIIGAMVIANVSLNAVSLVNLIISVGISLEFCAHIARAFQFPSITVMERAPRHRLRGKDARAWAALVNVGASVFSGITITKLLGVAVLAFTRSKIFEIYYFRVWVALIVFAASHALVFLPVALSLFGGQGKCFWKSVGEGKRVKLIMIQDMWIRSLRAASNRILEAGGTLPCWRMRSMIRTNSSPEESIIQ
jgi:hypothetical protein